MSKFITTNVKNIGTRDVFVYKGVKGYVIALTGQSALGDEDYQYRTQVSITYSDGTGEYKVVSVPIDENIELLRFDSEYYTWRKALLKNTNLEHLTV
jgi:hypothetical protein